MVEINWHDFPDDVYILFKDEFRAKFFKTAWKINRSYRHLAKKLGVSNPTMLAWRRGKDGAGFERGLSIKNLKEIVSSCNKSNNQIFSSKEIQKYIHSYKAKHGLKIINPLLPIKDSIALREFVVHLLCDGYAKDIRHSTHKYDSVSENTVKKIKDNLINTFGNIPSLNIRELKNPTKSGKKVFRLSFPKVITKILIKNLNINFAGETGRLPIEFFEGEKKLLIAVVRAFLIDEGSIRDLTIIFTNKNKELLLDLKKTCDLLGYECQKLRKSKEIYHLPISSKSFRSVYGDLLSIGSLPIKEKQKRLDLGSKLLNKKRIKLNLDNQILQLLSNKPMTTMDLSKELVLRNVRIFKSLNRLRKEDKIEVKNKKKGQGGPFIWKLASSSGT